MAGCSFPFRVACALVCYVVFNLCFAVELQAAPIPSDKAIIEEDHEKQQQENKYPQVNEATAAFSRGDIDEAYTLLESAVKAHPELSPPRVILARLFFRANQVPRGRGELERAVQDRPDDPEAYEALGNFALAEGRITEAGMLYRKVAELVAKMPAGSDRKTNLTRRAEAGLAMVAENRGQWQQALDHLQQWAKLDPKDYRPHLRTGQALFHLKKPNEAYKEFQAAAKLSDQTPPSEVLMGRLYQQAGDPKKADEWMKLAITRQPDNVTAQLSVAEWDFENEKLKEAKQAVDSALKLKPESTEAKLLRGLIARYEKDYPEAEKQLESAHLLAPANFLASNQLALVLSEQGDESKLRRAIQLAELNARQYGNNPEALATLGGIYLHAGKLDQAERALSRVISTGTISGDTAYYLAELCLKRDRQEDAVRYLRMALDSKGPFMNRSAAQALYDQLNKKS